MAPKLSKLNILRKKRSRNDAGQSSATEIEQDTNIYRSNTYLFRNPIAHTNFMGQFSDRKLSNCYYFNKASVTFSFPEDDKIIGFIRHWPWENLITCDEPYSEMITKTFYCNLTFSEDPFLVKSYVCGREIILSLDNVANWLGLVNEGEKAYLLRNWPELALESSDHYKTWFARRNFGVKPLYASSLPSLHRLLFLFVNNILIPKATIKSNIERGPMYYLRHLISMDEKRFNIPFIILRHMIACYSSSVANLPYGHLIHRMIRLHGITVPSHLIQNEPNHLLDILPKHGWVKSVSGSGLPMIKPDIRPINDWINAPNALPNQYWDPYEEESPAQPEQPPIPPMAQDELPQGAENQLAWIVQHMQEYQIANNNQFTAINNDLKILKSRSRKIHIQGRKNAEAIYDIDLTTSELARRFVKQYGASSGASTSAPHIPSEDDDDEDDEEGDEGDDDDDPEI